MGKKRVIALGFFDGIHIGHAALLRRTCARAAEIGAIPSALSFDTHPDTLVHGAPVPLINSAPGRADLIRRLFGIESVIFIHFDQTVMHMPWQDFAQTLIQEMDAAWLVVGHDFRFGWKGEGAAGRLADYCAAHGLGCDIIPAVTLDGRVVSSTYIRELIQNGEIERANAFLGHPHTLVDTVHYGYRLGTKMGTPTINMRFPDGVLVPKYGVYATKAFLEDGSEYMAVTNIGVRPTVSGGDRVSVESFILDFAGNLYDRQVRIEFYRFLRPEQRFADMDALKAQILRDAEETRAFFTRARLAEESKKREAGRLAGYDYSRDGGYYITLCPKDRRHPLSEIVEADETRRPAVHLTRRGAAVDAAIRAIPLHYDGVYVDKYVIMPNHVHLLLRIDHACEQTAFAPTVPQLIRQIERLAAEHAGEPIEQEAVSECVIRDENDYLTRWRQIDENPAKWHEDAFYTE